MEAKAKFLGHPVHQMLIAFPLGLLGAAVIFDFAFLVTQAQTMAFVAYWLISAGLIGAMAAIPFGIIDYTKIPSGTRAKRIGLAHGIGNSIVSALFALSWFLRDSGASPSLIALACSFAGLGLVSITAWLGGELVSRLGIGVYDKASPDASSSLKS